MKSMYLKIPINGITEEEKLSTKGILRSLITAVLYDLQEGGSKNVQFLLRERLSEKEKQNLVSSLSEYLKRHKPLEGLLESNGGEQISPSILNLIEIYGGMDDIYLPKRSK